MRVALVPLNPTVGAVTSNAKAIKGFVQDAIKENCDLVVFPEMSLIGYPAKDLVYFKELLNAQNKALKTLLPLSQKITIVVGGFVTNEKAGAPFQNVLFALQKGKTKTYAKQLLPNYDVFDDKRYFEPGTKPIALRIKGKKIGLSICEDLWFDDPKVAKRYKGQASWKAWKSEKYDLILNASASPFEINKTKRRKELLAKAAKTLGCPIAYVNQLGGNDDLIFDGGGFVYSKSGKLLQNLPPFKESLFVWDIDHETAPTQELGQNESIRQALKLGISDYVKKSGFEKVVLGLSGGIDSALVAQLAAEAIGKENVHGILLPSRYSSDHSLEDAKSLSHNLGISHEVISIQNLHEAYDTLFSKTFRTVKDLTAQNIQARIRSDILMAHSNNTGALLLNTTNKAEAAMGYGTLYGDLSGALSVIVDLTKTQVFALARHMNPNFEFIPESIFTKAPSAELKPDQKDSDSLPAYERLDPVVTKFVENFQIPKGQNKALFRQMMINEYKRQQSPLSLKVSEKAFGSGRRLPIVQKMGS